MREAAQRELAELGESALPALRKCLTAKPSAELKRRAEELIRAWESPEAPPARLFQLRAVTLLEQIGDASAKELLQTLAAGAKDAEVTRDAAGALGRLKRQSR